MSSLRSNLALQQTGLSVAALPLAPAAERRYVSRKRAVRTESIIRKIDSRSIEILNEPVYTFGSPDNSRRYQSEQVLGDHHLLTSRHGVICTENGKTLASIIFGAIGGASAVHEHSVVLLSDLCFIAVGPFVVCLDLPLLAVRWVREVDDATCFGVHLTPDQSGLISHGELEISRLSLGGDILWQRGGRDIFTGTFLIQNSTVRVEDFYNDVYLFELETGARAPGSA